MDSDYNLSPLHLLSYLSYFFIQFVAEQIFPQLISNSRSYTLIIDHIPTLCLFYIYIFKYKVMSTDLAAWIFLLASDFSFLLLIQTVNREDRGRVSCKGREPIWAILGHLQHWFWQVRIFWSPLLCNWKSSANSSLDWKVSETCTAISPGLLCKLPSCT